MKGKVQVFLFSLWAKIQGWFTTHLHVVEVHGDFLPDKFGTKQFIHLIDEGESWSAGFYCPCGCGDVLELALLHGVTPRWKLSIDSKGRPTLTPSVWRDSRCRSHFWIKQGKTHWCK